MPSMPTSPRNDVRATSTAEARQCSAVDGSGTKTPPAEKVSPSPTLISEHEVMFATAAATAKIGAARGGGVWMARVARLLRAAHDPSQRGCPARRLERDYLASARMSREMGRL
jgi:hypothetical protein